jgi:hypothetical protein
MIKIQGLDNPLQIQIIILFMLLHISIIYFKFALSKKTNSNQHTILRYL